MSVTKNVADYVNSMAINIAELSKKTGCSYTSLYNSICNKKRERPLKADEFMAICLVLKKNPMDFANTSTSQ